ncbi:glycosyltransferase [Dactylosporangium sp. NPDC048998]|uniref:glycosyltransferase n=1 Tax=Dactylosporangium sp. NPDC048998 TaxID=3363976 RepID=UPI0037226941
MTGFVLCAHGSRGDVDPFLALGAELARRLHDVVVMTHAHYGDAVRARALRLRAVDDVEGYQRHLRRTRRLIAPGARSMRDYYADAELFLDRVSVAGGFDQIRSELRALLREPDGVVIVGRLTSAIAGQMAAEATGAALCLVSLSPFQSATAPVTAMHLARAAGGPLNDIRREFGLPEVHDWSAWLLRADLSVGLWPAWFDEAGRRAPTGTLLTGFPLADDEPGYAPPPPMPVDRREDVVLVTGGTGRMLHDDFYPAAIAGVAAAGRRGIVVTPHRDLLPAVLPRGVVHVERLPFAAVMPTVAAVVHHGGIGTMARALSACTPQLVLADGGDRPDNGGRLQHLGLAACLTAGDWSPPRIADEIRRMTAAPAPEGLVTAATARTSLELLADRLTAIEPVGSPVAHRARS